MKKAFLILMLAAGSLMFSQTEKTSSPIRFGVKAGLNISFLEGASKAGFHGGGFINFPISSKLSIQPEVLYSGLGAKTNYVPVTLQPEQNEDVKLNLDYIAVPIMIQYNLIPNFYLEAGPQISFLVNSKLKYKSSSTDVTDDLRTVDYGLSIGAGYYFIPDIGVSARYVAGIGNIDVGGPTNNVILVGLIYKFK
jgi:hypothetical protein